MAELHATSGEARSGEGAEAGPRPRTDQETKDAEFKRARDAGWIDRTAFDYDAFTNTADSMSTGALAAAGQVYEWSEAYGEVGPEVPKLEKVLFGGEFTMRQGEHIENLEYLVNTEGPVQVGPIREVSEHVIISNHNGENANILN